MKPRWNIRIDWFVDDRRVLHGMSEFEADETCPEIRAVIVAAALRETNRRGLNALAKIADGWEWRQTTITLVGIERSRSITVKDRKMAMSEQEATECTERIMDWLDADETTELLTA